MAVDGGRAAAINCTTVGGSIPSLPFTNPPATAGFCAWHAVGCPETRRPLNGRIVVTVGGQHSFGLERRLTQPRRGCASTFLTMTTLTAVFAALAALASWAAVAQTRRLQEAAATPDLNVRVMFDGQSGELLLFVDNVGPVAASGVKGCAFWAQSVQLAAGGSSN